MKLLSDLEYEKHAEATFGSAVRAHEDEQAARMMVEVADVILYTLYHILTKRDPLHLYMAKKLLAMLTEYTKMAQTVADLDKTDESAREQVLGQLKEMIEGMSQ